MRSVRIASADVVVHAAGRMALTVMTDLDLTMLDDVH
jgi:hypothetical protein